MKKLSIFSSVVILVSLLLASPVLAKPGKGAVKGEVTAADPGTGTFTIETQKGEFVTVVVAGGFEEDEIAAGDWVLVKGSSGEGGVIEANWFKPIGKGRGKGEVDQDKPEGKKENSAFCAQGKQEQLHPLATKITERFEVVDGSWVMDTFCDGYSMGAIMLALKTRDLDGSDPQEVLQGRTDGLGWGQIWKEKGLIGSEKAGHSPYGQLKKLEKDEGD